MRRAEITAFFSLLFVLLVSFIFSVTESASIQTQKNRKRLDVDCAVFSLFGEYQKELLQKYGVFAIEASYGTGGYEEGMLLDRLAYYGSLGIAQEITDIQFLTDDGGKSFREQALTYMEQRTGISVLQNLTGIQAQWEERKIQGEQMEGELGQALSKSGTILPEEAEALLRSKESGLLSLVLPKEFSLSGKSVELAGQVSGRRRNVGKGSFPVRQGSGKTEDKVLFGQYIIENFNSAVKQKSRERNLEYEIEYILCGKEADAENLKEIAGQILLFRLAMNYAYLRTDQQKQLTAMTAAMAITAVLRLPAAMEVIRQAVLLLWSLGESIMDLRVLLSGKKAALVKNSENWQLSLKALFQLGTKEDSLEGQNEQKGMSYEDYLRVLLFLKDGNALTMRTLDRVEQNLIFESGLDFFRADNCVTKIKIKNTAEIWKGCSYTFPVYYGYL